MSLKEQLFADLKTAMKEKDTVKKDTDYPFGQCVSFLFM